MPALTATDLRKRFGARTVLAGLDLELATDGRVYGLFGPNGVGKTTLFRCLLGLETADGGTVSFDGRELTRLPPDRIARLGLTMMFQKPVALEGLTVAEHLRLVLEASDAAERVDSVLREHELAGLADSPVASLSFGEAKLIDFARVTALEPRVLLLDEPFSGMDPMHVTAIKERVRAVANPGRAVLLTDHNLHAALPFVDYAFVLYDGRLLFAGTPEEVRADEGVRGLYLGAEA